MTLDEAKSRINSCASQMDARYGNIVFDEWAVVSLAENTARVLAYIGPRNDDFLKNFAGDLGALRAELRDASYGIGDFAFARHGVGTGFEAFLVLGRGIYLICNNTRGSMDSITKDALARSPGAVCRIERRNPVQSADRHRRHGFFQKKLATLRESSLQQTPVEKHTVGRHQHPARQPRQPPHNSDEE